MVEFSQNRKRFCTLTQVPTNSMYVLYVCMYVCMYVCIYMYVYVMYVCIYDMYVGIICMYVCIICMYICMYIGVRNLFNSVRLWFD